MNKNIIIILLYISFTLKCSIRNGVYNLLVDNLYISYNNKNISLIKYSDFPKTFFRLIRVSGNFDDSFFCIKYIKNNINLSYSKENILTFENKYNNLSLWKFIKIDENIFVIKNYNNCYLKINKPNFFCENISQNEATPVELNKIFFEEKKKKNKINRKLLSNEPIDVLIKYIDLKDPNLNRNGIHQIEKDYDNEELRYCIRSILNYIPWINKIFILMPNDKVSYFKEYKYIKERIVYIKDKDLLGYDSSNSLAFQYRYWKMKKFGISDNIIVMDDDYFINKKLKKSDFFYVNKGKIFPFIVTSHFITIERDNVQKKRDFYEVKAKFSKEEQNSDVFNYQKYLTFLFILNIFNIPSGKNIYIPKFTHNAIPLNLHDIKEVYNLVYNSPYRNTTLNCQYRHYENLQFQILVTSFTFLKYSRRINDITFKFISMNDSISERYDTALFCINKIAGYYSYINLYKAKIMMEYLFPKPSKYEIIDYSLFNIILNVTRGMDKIIKSYEKKRSLKLKTEKHYFFKILISIFLFLLLYFKFFYKKY